MLKSRDFLKSKQIKTRRRDGGEEDGEDGGGGEEIR